MPRLKLMFGLARCKAAAPLILWLVIWTAAQRSPADNLPPEVRLLEQVRQRMAETLSRLPNYTCLQTIERMTRGGGARKFQLMDMVRLQVALVSGRELFSWPGAKKFDDREISDIVTGGAIGNGNFAIHAKAVFLTNHPRFTYMGERTREGRRTHRWDFVVPQPMSGYTLRARPNEAVVGYHGSIWADAETLDLVRLQVQADDVPPVLKISDARDAVEYRRMKIGPEMFLLPEASEMIITDMQGNESRNRTTFTGCQQYTGESVITFEDPTPGAAQESAVRHISVNAGLSLDIELLTPVSHTNAAVGDPVTAVLKKAVKLAPDVRAPKGALVHGRITMLRRQDTMRPGFVVALQFFEIEFGNTRASLNARLESIAAAPTLYSTSPSSSGWGHGSRLRVQPAPNVPGSVFFAQGYTLRLDRGFRMLWRTEAPDPED